jgi:hypothetical protein
MSLADFLGRLTATFEDLELDYMIVGSLASTLHGIGRSTQDIDIVVALTPGRLGWSASHFGRGPGLVLPMAMPAIGYRELARSSVISGAQGRGFARLSTRGASGAPPGGPPARHGCHWRRATPVNVRQVSDFTSSRSRECPPGAS